METLDAAMVSSYVPCDPAACLGVGNGENDERALPLSAHSVHFSSAGPYDVLGENVHLSRMGAAHSITQKTPSVSSTHLSMYPSAALNSGSMASSSSSHLSMLPSATMNTGSRASFSSTHLSMLPSATLNTGSTAPASSSSQQNMFSSATLNGGSAASATLNGGSTSSIAGGARSSSLNFFAEPNGAPEHLVPFSMDDNELNSIAGSRSQVPTGVVNAMEGALVMVDAEELMDGHAEEIDQEILDISEMLAHSMMRMLWRSNQMESILCENLLAAGDFIPFVQRHLSRHVPQLIPLLQDSDACTTSSDESTEETESTVTSELSHASFE